MDKGTGILDWNIFDQILEMDEEQVVREFSRGIVEKYYEQAESTFVDMEQALAAGDRNKLSQLGHFLKGSSASLGLTKVQNTCEEIQHIDGSACSDEDVKQLIDKVRAEYNEAHNYLEQFYTTKVGSAN